METLKDIAIKAGVEVLKIYGENDFQVELKGDDSPLTVADRAANEVICRGLEEMNESYPILSEENKEIAYADRKEYSRYWCVDPLDGTKEFIKRNGEFTINIALIEDGRSIAGVVYVPVRGALYWAEKDKGAFRQIDGETTALKCNSYSNDQEGLTIVCSRSHLNEETQAFLDQYKKPRKLSCGSSLKFLKIAEGQADLYPRLAPTMEWDTAAAQIILEEAGGRVYQADTGEPLAYNKESLRNPHFIATGSQAVDG